MAFDPANFAAVLARHGLPVPATTSTAPEAEPLLPAALTNPAQKGADAKETLMSTDEITAKAIADATAAAAAKLSAVTASEHYKGRETLASTLLAQPSLTSEAIIAALAAAPSAAAIDANAETQAQADAKLAAELLAGHRAGNPPPTGADAQIPTDSGWSAIYDELNAAA